MRAAQRPDCRRAKAGNGLSEQDSRPSVGWAKDKRDYNDRLFGTGLRGWFHGGRFRWLRVQIRRRSSAPPSVLEIGCFDGKVLNFIAPSPRRYLGLDANWEGGLDLAKVKWAGFQGAEFRKCQKPEEVPTGERFDVAIVMETLEHLPDDVLDGYIARLREVTDGYLLITSPNEIGPVCFAKQIVKKAFLGGSSFSWADIWNATLGRTERIVRDEHRGFNYRHLIETLRKSFDVESVHGIPFSWAPPYLNFTVGIVLVPKPKERQPAR